MIQEDILAVVKEHVLHIIEDKPEVFLVRMKIKPTNNIKVYLDSDTGLSIDVIIKINRMLYKKMEESEMFPTGDFSLEVSSAGVDEPLVQLRQYQKNMGRSIEVKLLNGEIHTGKLVQVSEANIVIEKNNAKPNRKPKESDIELKEFALLDVEATTVLITFK